MTFSHYESAKDELAMQTIEDMMTGPAKDPSYDSEMERAAKTVRLAATSTVPKTYDHDQEITASEYEQQARCPICDF